MLAGPITYLFYKYRLEELQYRLVALELREMTDTRAGVAIFCHVHRRAEEFVCREREEGSSGTRKEVRSHKQRVKP